eukprot:GFUD01013713.1.p1 GENE.GFUD01013713.1~~GFUD01013713.1.p1  ORF type:complete len:163 (+),score=29.46 GFUD01013713.1:62-550(+)
MAQTNLILKILLCLIVPAFHTMQANIGTNNGLSALRYWLLLSSIFLTELLMDQLNLSPGFTIIKLGFMFWCVAPIENNGSHFILEKIIQPLFKVSKSLLSDVMKNKLMEEAMETIQDMTNNIGVYFPSLRIPGEKEKREPSIFKHFLSLDQENITAIIVYLN